MIEALKRFDNRHKELIKFFVRRCITAAGILFFISMIVFGLIELAPGDFVDRWANQKAGTGTIITQSELEAMRVQLGLDQPFLVRYLKWAGNFLMGDLGYSWSYRGEPVAKLIGNRVGLTVLLLSISLFFSYFIGIPIGIYSAVKKYTVGDHSFTFLGYLGMATPNFFLALIIMYLFMTHFGWSPGGLFSPEFAEAAWNFARFVDFSKHLLVAVIVLGTAATAGTLRVMRSIMLDELDKMYVNAARATGLNPLKIIMKYPFRVACIPIASSIGWTLTSIISGAPIVGMVLNLPDMGPLYLKSLQEQDMNLAAAMVMIYCFLTVVGTVISDIVLALVDVRIRKGGDVL